VVMVPGSISVDMMGLLFSITSNLYSMTPWSVPPVLPDLQEGRNTHKTERLSVQRISGYRDTGIFYKERKKSLTKKLGLFKLFTEGLLKTLSIERICGGDDVLVSL
jgi:hypothetical protein